MGLFGKISTLAAIALPGKAIAASRGKTAAGGTPPPPPPPTAGGGVLTKAKTGGPGPGSLGGIAAPAPGGQVQGRQMNAFRAGQRQPPAPPSGSQSIWEAGSKRRADKTEL